MMHETNDNVRNLHARVVDVVLNLDAFASRLQNPHKRVAQHGIANVTDVRGFVWIDAGVFDHFLWSIRC